MAEETGVVKYDATEAGIAVLSEKYMPLTVTDVNDDAGFAMVHQARMDIKGIRVATEKRRKELKSDALAWGKKVDTKAKEIFALLAPIETHLQTEEDKVTKEKERVKAEKIQAELDRVNGIKEKIAKIEKLAMIPNGCSLDELNKRIEIADSFDPDEKCEGLEEQAKATKNTTLDTLTAAYKDREKWEKEQAEAKAEADRLAKQKEEQDARQKVIDDANAKLEADKKEADDKKIAFRISQLKNTVFNSVVAIDGSGITIISREDLISMPDAEFDQFAKSYNKIFDEKVATKEAELKAQAEKEAKEKLEREAEEKAEREAAEEAERKRQEALRPDKEKLIKWAESIASLVVPEVKSDEAQNIVSNAENHLAELSISIIKDAEELS